MTISSASEVSSFTKLFSDDMKEEFIKVKDMVQILIEDQRESVQLCAQLLTMQEEKEAILQRLHDMDLQLLQAGVDGGRYVGNVWEDFSGHEEFRAVDFAFSYGGA